MADKIKLALALAIVAAGIWVFYYLADQPDIVRVLALLAAIGVAVAVALATAPGQATWEFAKSARQELRKVVWPTNRETMQVTVVVFAMVVAVALFLWVVDWGLNKAVRYMMGTGA